MLYKIAIVGSGISGLVCAYLLSREHEVHLFEANDSLGGHTHTVSVDSNDKLLSIDCGFIVFNKKTYPNFTKLLEKEKIPYQPSEMSFSFYDPEIPFYYNGHSLSTLFVDKKNRTDPFFYQMLFDIFKFNLTSTKQIRKNEFKNLSLAGYLQKTNYSSFFINYYLIPMISAIWSCPQDKALEIPLTFLVEFYANHGLLNVFSRPQWYVIENGSNRYIPSLITRCKENIHLSSKVDKISRKDDQVFIHTEKQSLAFDKVIIATHSDEALALLENPSENEVDILSKILYQNNHVVLHTDSQILPPNKKAWASWNYYKNKSGVCTLNYYANRLQNIKNDKDYIISVNLKDKIAPESIIKEMNFSHPIYSKETIAAQKKFSLLNGHQNTYFCGAYWGNGFHEDGVVSALKVCAEFKAYL